MSDDIKHESRIDRAQRLFKQYYASCFWHLKPDLVVTEAELPLIIRGLRSHGGREAFLAADQLVREERN